MKNNSKLRNTTKASWRNPQISNSSSMKRSRRIRIWSRRIIRISWRASRWRRSRWRSRCKSKSFTTRKRCRNLSSRSRRTLLNFWMTSETKYQTCSLSICKRQLEATWHSNNHPTLAMTQTLWTHNSWRTAWPRAAPASTAPNKSKGVTETWTCRCRSPRTATTPRIMAVWSKTNNWIIWHKSAIHLLKIRGLGSAHRGSSCKTPQHRLVDLRLMFKCSQIITTCITIALIRGISREI